MPGGHKFGANGIKFDMNVPDNGLNNIQSVLGHLEKLNFWVNWILYPSGLFGHF